MSSLLERPVTHTSPPAPAEPSATPAPDPAGAHQDWLLLPVAALLVAACVSFARVFVGLDFVRPVLAAAGLSLAVSWSSRRLGTGPFGTLLAAALTWLVFVGVAFAPDSLAGGALPTTETLAQVQQLWGRGLELMRTRPAPVFAEPALLLITTTGVWAIAHTIEGLVFWFRSPARAVVMALVLWVVPLSMAPITPRAWPWALPFMVAAAALMLAFSGADLVRWGRVVASQERSSGASPLLRTGALVASAAILAGALFAGALPGFGEEAWYGARGSGGTTLTSNPMVDIRTRLVSTDPTPVLRVTTPRPLYLRVTSLDVYRGDKEEWTNSGIRGRAVDNPLPPEVPIAQSELVPMELTDVGLGGPVLVPAPYQLQLISGPQDTRFQYDRSLSTLTVDPEHGLDEGDTYQVVAAVPTPDAATLRAIDPRGVDGAIPRGLVALPPEVPAEVTERARAIVAAAGARTAFDQALAIQNELRSWTYSLTPPQGHGGVAMTAFLESRTGYCEQFAGTMAVMLRTLGIPTRVAVGFTPGTPVEPAADTGAPTTYLISQANAHAWVEVLFPGAGWIAFEPTPRSDGNVLVPTAGNLAPAATLAQEAAAEGGALEPAPRPDDEFLLDEGALSADEEEEAWGAARGAASGGEGPGWGSGLGLLLAGIGLAVFAAMATARGRSRSAMTRPAARVLLAVSRVEELGRGLGLRRRRAETDREYLTRLTAEGSPGETGAAAEAAADLADATARARWSPEVGADAAQRAERAAGVLATVLLADRSAPARSMVYLRGWAAVTAEAAGRALAARTAALSRRPPQ